MKTLSINISENDLKNYGFGEEPVSFKEIEKKIRSAFIKQTLKKCREEALDEGLSEMSLDEINREIEGARNEMREKDAQNNS